ncbi:PRT1p [Coprinopsis cinerea AmutBmut pab1-1]|nr:PRT1p [Coprinopsis cinerea AmutBmut pab1-1]
MPAQNIDDIDYSDIEAKYQVHFDDSLDNTVVVDGLPVIDPSKQTKLLSKVVKEFSKRGVAVKADDIFLPWDQASGKSKGYAFIEFRNIDDANHAIAVLDRHPFDANHTFRVNKFTDIETLANFDERYEEPEDEEYAPREHLRSWLADPQGRDQYM